VLAKGAPSAKAWTAHFTGVAPDPASILALCRAELAAYKAPRAIQFVADPGRTSTGKIMRRKLATLNREADLLRQSQDEVKGRRARIGRRSLPRCIS
jgi:acyl-CoA synthetase (AMP-forming)/AMP-acid ligase II